MTVQTNTTSVKQAEVLGLRHLSILGYKTVILLLPIHLIATGGPHDRGILCLFVRFA